MTLIHLPLIPLLLLTPLDVAPTSKFEPLTTSAEHNRILAALESDTEFEFQNISFQDALKQIAQRHAINIVLDNQSLEQVRSQRDVRGADVHLIISNVRLRSALKVLLEPFDLDYTIEDEVLKIAAAREIAALQSTVAYNVAPLVKDDVTELAEAVHKSLPATARPAATVSGYRNVLLVTGNRHVQESARRSLRLIDDALRQ